MSDDVVGIPITDPDEIADLKEEAEWERLEAIRDAESNAEFERKVAALREGNAASTSAYPGIPIWDPNTKRAPGTPRELPVFDPGPARAVSKVVYVSRMKAFTLRYREDGYVELMRIARVKGSEIMSNEHAFDLSTMIRMACDEFIARNPE